MTCTSRPSAHCLHSIPPIHIRPLLLNITFLHPLDHRYLLRSATVAVATATATTNSFLTLSLLPDTHYPLDINHDLATSG